ncbi:MAG: CCA tRNA nucleotidyltransferase [Nitrospirae bacterium]|nr:CCA tRNA nucleotidyltransferase [Nitrospirota bacterium]
MDISKRILSDPLNKWLFAQTKNHLYLAGGYLRDLIIGRTSKDRDFVFNGDAAKLAKQVARRFNGTFVLLKEDLTCRIVLKDKNVVDINYLTEPIEDDLARRDFTINAIAWSPDRGLLDPFNGISDITRNSIRVINPLNLKADPLRVLRAYRFSAQLGYKITTDTRNELKKYAEGLKSTAPERITDELIKLLNYPKAGNYLQICINDNVLTHILNIKLDSLLSNIIYIKKFDSLSNTLSLYTNYLQSIISQDMTRSAMIRLALLHAQKGTQDQHSDNLLKLSRANAVALKKILDVYHISCSLRIDQHGLFRAFSKAGKNSIEAAVLIGITKRRDILPLVKKAKEFINIKKNPLLSGDLVQDILGIGPGHKIGVILAQLEEEQFRGNITSIHEAKRWIMSNLT